MSLFHRTCAIGLTGMVAGLTLLLSNTGFAAPWVGVRFVTRVQPAACPAGTSRTAHCFRITGPAIGVSRAHWRRLDRLAIVGGNSAVTVPPHCIPATTRGRLMGTVGTVRFSGSGYFCPRTDRAEYRYQLVNMSRAANGLADRGLIIYDGHSNIERFKPTP